MSRSGYVDDCCDDYWGWIKYRGQVASATRGRRGQQLLKDALEALEAMPVKELVASELEDGEGNVCTLGAVGKKRCIDMSGVDPLDYDKVAATFDIAAPLAREIESYNDEEYGTRARRWAFMRNWIRGQIKDQEWLTARYGNATEEQAPPSTPGL